MTDNNSNKLVSRTDNIIYFYDEITPETALLLNKYLREAEDWCLYNKLKGGKRKLIELHINSLGGETPSAWTVIHTINKLSVDVHTFVDGNACSAAVILFLSGTKRTVFKNSSILIHQLSQSMWGTHTDFKDNMKLQKTEMKQIISYIVKNTRINKQQLKEKMRRNWWIDYKKAKKLGFIK